MGFAAGAPVEVPSRAHVGDTPGPHNAQLGTPSTVFVVVDDVASVVEGLTLVEGVVVTVVVGCGAGGALAVVAQSGAAGRR